jgi:hypothetical protein
MKTWATVLLLAALAGCASTSIEQVDGERALGDSLVVRVDSAWNKMNLPGSKEPYETWTQEGLTLDHLRFWSGVPSGQAIAQPSSAPAGGVAPRVPTFVSGMSPEQLVQLFEVLYASDGSLVTMGRVAPARFAGGEGLRFEFDWVRKEDDVQLKGVGWLAVRQGKLYAATFAAPRLHFFGRLYPQAQAVIDTATVRP